MKFDLTVTITAILALSAILSPIFVALINNRYQLKIKRIELAQSAMLEVFESYISVVIELKNEKSDRFLGSYFESYSKAVLYADREASLKMLKINESVLKKEYDKITESQILDLSKQFKIILHIH